jgi:flavin reductase (DIM6/NTAB) family NADH-FMN oxidoreductase RutF
MDVSFNLFRTVFTVEAGRSGRQSKKPEIVHNADYVFHFRLTLAMPMGTVDGITGSKRRSPLMEIHANTLGPEETYRLMTGVVVPRPIAWVTTLSKDGVINLAPFSCFTFVSNKPPMVGVNIGRKAGMRKDTGRNIRDMGEFVVNVGDETMIEQIHLSAVEHPPEVSETELLGLETAASQKIGTPRLAIVPISMECRLSQVIPFGDTGSEFFVGEVLVFHIRDGLYAQGKIDTAKLRPTCRLGGPFYAKLGEIVQMRAIGQTRKTVIKE